MISLTTVTATSPGATPSAINPWLTSLYAGVITAIIAFVVTWFFPNQMILYLLAFVLIGAGPVLGYQAATRVFDWKPLVGGLIGFILLFLGFLLWPILVGAMGKKSIGKLFLASVIGFIVGVVALLTYGVLFGQNPTWLTTGFILLWAFWAGTCGATLAALDLEKQAA